MKQFNEREYNMIKNSFIVLISKPEFMNNEEYLSIIKENFDVEERINPKILKFVFNRTSLAFGMTIIEFCHQYIPDYKDEDFLRISDGYSDFKDLFHTIFQNEKLIELFPGNLLELRSQFVEFATNYINEIYLYVDGEILINNNP